MSYIYSDNCAEHCAQSAVLYSVRELLYTVRSRVYRIYEGELNNKISANRDVIKSSVENAVTSIEDFYCGN